MTRPPVNRRPVAVVTGGVEGIGWATTEGLVCDGFHVVLAARVADDRLAERIDKLAASGGSAEPFVADVTDPAATNDLYRSVFTNHRRLDALVANAGVLGDARLGMISEQALHDTFDVNTMGGIRHLQAAARLMTKAGSGSIVLIGSIMGLAGNPGQVLYSASKAALVGAMRSGAKELGPAGVRVNVVAPGYISTRMIEGLTAELDAERVANIALGRPGTASEVASVVRFLCSDAARYVTGQAIGVDGGMVV